MQYHQTVVGGIAPEFGDGKHLHIVVVGTFEGLAQGCHIGMRRVIDNGHLVARFDNLHEEGAMVVLVRHLTVQFREVHAIMVHSLAFGLHAELHRLKIAVTTKGELLAVNFRFSLLDRQLGLLARQLVDWQNENRREAVVMNWFRDFYRELNKKESESK